jgi:hypothetical protein
MPQRIDPVCPRQPEIEASNLEGEMRHIVLAERRAEKNPKRIDERYDERRGRTETRAHRRSTVVLIVAEIAAPRLWSRTIRS